jgi:hypothetical protein
MLVRVSEIWDSHGSEDVVIVLGYDAVWTEDGNSIFLWNVGIYLQVCIASQPRTAALTSYNNFNFNISCMLVSLYSCHLIYDSWHSEFQISCQFAIS